ncbi:MAG: hypothetical protein ACI86S_001476 [Paracoccaceae bacterium]|jgi:hypothetical protein
MNSATEKLRRKLERANRNRRYNAKAKATLAGMHGELSKTHRTLCDEYARDALGSRAYAPWLYIYSHTAGEFHEGWIPDNYYSNYVARMRSAPRLSGRHVLATSFPGHEALPDIAYLKNGRGYTFNSKVLDPQSLMQTLFAQSDQVIFKSDGSSRGIGIQFITRATFDPDQIGALGNGVFQNVITQHPDFDSISQGSLATIRITTAANKKGIPTIRATYLRVARSKETRTKSQTALRVGFEIDAGRLSDVVYLTDWNTIACHPDTGARFAGTCNAACQTIYPR